MPTLLLHLLRGEEREGVKMGVCKRERERNRKGGKMVVEEEEKTRLDNCSTFLVNCGEY